MCSPLPFSIVRVTIAGSGLPPPGKLSATVTCAELDATPTMR
jgi:hypothetical protein